MINPDSSLEREYSEDDPCAQFKDWGGSSAHSVSKEVLYLLTRFFSGIMPEDIDVPQEWLSRPCGDKNFLVFLSYGRLMEPRKFEWKSTWETIIRLIYDNFIFEKQNKSNEILRKCRETLLANARILATIKGLDKKHRWRNANVWTCGEVLLSEVEKLEREISEHENERRKRHPRVDKKADFFFQMQATANKIKEKLCKQN